MQWPDWFYEPLRSREKCLWKADLEVYALPSVCRWSLEVLSFLTPPQSLVHPLPCPGFAIYALISLHLPYSIYLTPPFTLMFKWVLELSLIVFLLSTSVWIQNTLQIQTCITSYYHLCPRWPHSRAPTVSSSLASLRPKSTLGTLLVFIQCQRGPSKTCQITSPSCSERSEGFPPP